MILAPKTSAFTNSATKASIVSRLRKIWTITTTAINCILCHWVISLNTFRRIWTHSTRIRSSQLFQLSYERFVNGDNWTWTNTYILAKYGLYQLSNIPLICSNWTWTNNRRAWIYWVTNYSMLQYVCIVKDLNL